MFCVHLIEWYENIFLYFYTNLKHAETKTFHFKIFANTKFRIKIVYNKKTRYQYLKIKIQFKNCVKIA